MATNRKNNFKLLSDEPILESDRADFLEFEHTAKVLARAGLYTDSPITIGVYGNWGSGKTSLMRLMKQIIEKEGTGENAAVAVWFNAWQYEREEHLLVPLIATIARDIKKRQELWEKEQNNTVDKALEIMKTGGKKVHDALRSVLYGISMKGKLGVPLLGELEISASMKDMIERYEAVTQDTLMARSLYFDAFDQLRELSHKKEIKKPQIIVFIDDLDRCFPEQAVRLLESIKLVLHQPNFAFVLGIYPQIIEEFIRNKYAAQYPLAAVRVASRDDKELQSRMDKYLDYFNDYLGKIVQVSHDVPERPPGQMQNYIRHLLDDAGVTSEFLVKGVSEEDLLETIAEVGNRSPREIVRKINWLIVKWRITKSEKGADETFDLLAGLINDMVVDRIAKGKHGYQQFLQTIEWTIDDEDSLTYGKKLSDALEETQDITDHWGKIQKLKEILDTENSRTIGSLIDILEQDEHLCNVLNSSPGRRWLSDKNYREEMHETYKEKEQLEDTPETISEIKEEPGLKRELDKQRSGNLEQIMPGLKIVDIAAGKFQMGSDEDDSEKPIHTVNLKSFKISATPVTQRQYEIIMGVNPSKFQNEGELDTKNHPVEMVNWKDALMFCEQLTKLTKGKYRVTLPTEAQWEYACRAGTTTPFNTGENLTTDQANYNGNYPYKKFPKGEYIQRTSPVDKYSPNDWGLYDMHGNVWEWCLDNWHDNYEGAPIDGSVWEIGGSSYRVMRGGSWRSDARNCRSAHRFNLIPGLRNSDIGFRLVFVPLSVGS